MRYALALLFALLATEALAQSQSQVVQTCGNISPSYPVGAVRTPLMDINGNTCIGGLVGGQGTGPGGVTMVNGASGNVAAATATATLVGVAGKTTYICGFTVTSTGSTAATVVAGPTVAPIVSANMVYTYTSVAGVTLGNPPLTQAYNPCLPANAANTAITVTLPSLGAGNTNTTVNAWGYQQ